MFLLDLLPFGGAEVFVLIAFFFVALGSGVFAFVMLRKSIKMAIRLAVVAAILLIAIFGSIALWLFMKPSPRSNRNFLTPTPPSRTNSTRQP